jgi:hypothetical protein
MNFFGGKLKNFFTEQPLPSSAIQVTSSSISGVHLSSKERKLKHHFILPLPEKMIQPSLDRVNIKDAQQLMKTITERVEKFNIYRHGISLLLPELSQRTFVFAFDSLPKALREREKIIRFKIKKQMPLLSDDVRTSFDVIQTKDGIKVISSVARVSVVAGYEQFFSQMSVKIKAVGVPILGLSNLIDWTKEKDFLLVNIERDSFGLLAITNSEPSLYRQKPLMALNQDDLTARVQNIVQEIENTAHFIEDKEKRSLATIWIRMGVFEPEDEMLSNLEEKLSFAVKSIHSLLNYKLRDEEKMILAPLLGQLQ